MPKAKSRSTAPDRLGSGTPEPPPSRNPDSEAGQRFKADVVGDVPAVPKILGGGDLWIFACDRRWSGTVRQKQNYCVGVCLGYWLKRFQMPRYFFHIRRRKLQLDHDGEEFPDKQAALKEAAATAARIIQDTEGLRPGEPWRLNVTDEFANPLFEINVSTTRFV